MSENQKRNIWDLTKICSPIISALLLLWGIFTWGVRLEADLVKAYERIEIHDEKLVQQEKINDRQDLINNDLYGKHNELQRQLNEIYKAKYK